MCVLASARAEAGSVGRAAAASAALEIAAALVAGAVVGVAAGRRAGARGAAGAALAATAASCALFAIANGAVAFLPDRTSMAGTGALAAVLAAGGALAANATLGPPRSPAFALFVEPPLLAAGFYAACTARFEARLAPGSKLGVALVLGGAAAGLAAIALVRRLRVGTPEPPSVRALTAGSLGAAMIAVGAGLVAQQAPPVPAGRRGGPPDILLVVLDTVRADAAPAPPGASSPTPELDRLAHEGTRYASAFSTSCWTLPAHASLFTGLTARAHGVGWESTRLPAGVETLAEQLAGAGYRTAGFSANIWVSPEFGFDRGFDRFVVLSAADRPMAPWSLRLVPSLFAGLDASLPFDDKGGLTLATRAVRFLGSEDDRPAFAFVNLLEAHMPYAPPERFLRSAVDGAWSRDDLLGISYRPLQGLAPESAPSSRDLAGLKRLYGAEVAYDDALLARLIEPLRAAGRLDRTVVVVVGDHGENLGAHPPLDHQLGLWDSLGHVPLIVRYPAKIEAGATSTALVSVADVRAAVTCLSGGACLDRNGALPGAPRRGAVTLAYDRPGFILERIRDDLGLDPSPWDRRLDAVRTAGAKWILGSDGSRAAFDVARDPGETRNLVTGAGIPEGFEGIAALLDAVLDERRTAPTPGSRPISEETRRRLRSLGYVH